MAGMIANFLNNFMEIWLIGKKREFNARLKNDPELIKLMEDLDQNLASIKRHFDALKADERYRDIFQK
jgi:hypothetical protein